MLYEARRGPVGHLLRRLAGSPMMRRFSARTRPIPDDAPNPNCGPYSQSQSGVELSLHWDTAVCILPGMQAGWSAWGFRRPEWSRSQINMVSETRNIHHSVCVGYIIEAILTQHRSEERFYRKLSQRTGLDNLATVQIV
jgi:hypothetical protein